MDKTGLVLDFTSLTDPSLLFSSLVAFRQSHGVLYTSNENVRHFAVEWPDEPGLNLDVSDPRALSVVCQGFDQDSLAFEAWNLPLALRLVQHAVREGYLRVLDGPESEIDPDWLRTFSVGAQLVTYRYKDHQVAVAAGAPWALRSDVNLALTNHWHVCIANLKFQDAVAAGGTQFSSSVPASLGQIVTEWRPSSIGDIYRAIDSPRLFTSIADAAKRLGEQEKYEHELVTFLPRLVSDVLTHHAASVVEMLYTILSWRHRKK